METVQVQGSSTSGGDAFGLLWLRKTFQNAPRGQVFTFGGTSSTSSVADTWTTLTTTWNDTLPEGRYAVVGLEVIGATQVAARLIFNDSRLRPGCLSMGAVTDLAPPVFRKGRLGMWGSFLSTALPEIQVLNTGAALSFTIYMDIVKIG